MSEKQPAKKEFVTLIYNKSNIISFQLDPKQPLFILQGGSNIIPKDIFELMKKDSILNGKIESGVIDVLDDASKSGDPLEVYKSLKPKSKRDLILNSTNAEHLKAWLESEKNEDLKKLIEEQHLKVAGPVVYRD